MYNCGNMNVSSFKKKAAAGAYDFLDFGASKGASIEFAKEHLFGKKGLGIDLDPDRVEAMNKAGYDCMVGDITDLKLPSNCVEFVKMAHILEHLPDIKGVEDAVACARKSATNFLVITGPFFDEDKYLASKGFKLYWSDYPVHTCHLKVSQLMKILQKLKLSDYELYLRYPLSDSSDEHIQPLNSPSGLHKYDPAIHPPKKHVVFDRAIWTDFVCYVQLKETKNWNEITKAYKNQIPHIEQKGGVKYDWPDKAVKELIAMDAEIQLREQTIRDLKYQKKQLFDKLMALQRRLAAPERVKSRQPVKVFFQRVVFVSRHPRAGLKKVSKRFKL
jgi:hypothetical protein